MMAPGVATPLLLLLLQLPSDSASRCPSTEVQTLWGRETLVCSGHGRCNETSGECACQRGDVYGSPWQVAPENILASRHKDCSGMKAKASSLVKHRLLLAATYLAELAVCWVLFGRASPRNAGGVSVPCFGNSPWLLPRAAGLSAVATIVATVLSALLAGADCHCFWLADFHKYETISGLAMHPPMTIVTPIGVLISTFFLTAAACAAVKWAAAHPTGCYADKWSRAAFGVWALNALNSALWGLGVNVYFNESWDHNSHIQLSGYYFVSACLNNLFLFIALWPLIKLQYPDMRIHQASFARDRRVRRAFHYAWVSVVAGILYGLLYKWKGKPSWSLGVCEHAMSIFVALSFAQTLGAFMRSGEEAATGGRGTALQASLLLTP